MTRQRTALLALAAVLLLIGLSAATAPVAAQSAGNETTDNATTETDVEQGAERIDENTVLLSSSYSDAEETARVRLRSESLQEIVITDGSYLLRGTEATQRSVMVKPGEVTTIEIPSKEVDGVVALSIATSETVYGEPIRVDTTYFGASPSWEEARLMALAGLSAGLLATVVIAIYLVKIRGLSSERVL